MSGSYTHRCGEGAALFAPERAYCPRCRALLIIGRAAEEELPLPRGFTVGPAAADARPGPTRVSAGYREAALAPSSGRARITRSWARQWWPIGVFLLVVSTVPTLGAVLMLATIVGLLDGTIHGSRWSVVPIAAVSGVLLHLALALLVNSTDVVVAPGEIRRVDRPLPWRREARWERRAGERVITRAARENDLRNASARWPAPETHQVVITSDDGSRELVLFEQLHRTDEARQVAAALRALLRS